MQESGFPIGVGDARYVLKSGDTMTGALTLANVASSLTMPELTLGSIPFAGTGGIVSQDNANFFWDDTNNRLGLGTSAPAYLLQIGGNGGLNASLDVQANNGSSWFKIVSGNVTFNAAGGKTIAGGADLGARFNISAINDTYPTLSIRGYTAGVSDIFRVSSPTLATGNLLIIKSTGRVGIGTTSPTALLDLNSTNGGDTDILRISNPSASAGSIYGLAWRDTANNKTYARIASSYGASYVNSYLSLSVADSTETLQERMRIDKSGNVGIGTASPGEKLDVYGRTADMTIGSRVTYGSILSTIPNARLSVLNADNNSNAYDTPVDLTLLQAHNASDLPPVLNFIKTRGDAYGGLSSGEDLGMISFKGSDGSQYMEGVRIMAERDTATAWANMQFHTNDGTSLQERVRITGAGNVGIGTTSPSAVLHLKAGTATASTAPLKFTSGTLLTTAEAGAVEFLTDDFYATITTGAARKKFVLDDGMALTATRVPFATTNGRLTDDADFTFATDTLTATKIVGTTSVKVGTAAGYISSDGSTGATGTFTTADAKTVTVKDGIITNIV